MEEIKSKKKSLLRVRYDSMLELYKLGDKGLPQLEELEYRLGADLGLYNDCRREMVRMKSNTKSVLKSSEKFKSVAEFDRRFEETEEYLGDKEYRFCIEGLINMKISVASRVKALRASARGTY